MLKKILGKIFLIVILGILFQIFATSIVEATFWGGGPRGPRPGPQRMVVYQQNSNWYFGGQRVVYIENNRWRHSHGFYGHVPQGYEFWQNGHCYRENALVNIAAGIIFEIVQNNNQQRFPTLSEANLPITLISVGNGIHKWLYEGARQTFINDRWIVFQGDDGNYYRAGPGEIVETSRFLID